MITLRILIDNLNIFLCTIYYHICKMACMLKIFRKIILTWISFHTYMFACNKWLQWWERIFRHLHNINLIYFQCSHGWIWSKCKHWSILNNSEIRKHLNTHPTLLAHQKNPITRTYEYPIVKMFEDIRNIPIEKQKIHFE